MKISENDHLSEILGAFIKFSQLILQGMYCGQSGELNLFVDINEMIT